MHILDTENNEIKTLQENESRRGDMATEARYDTHCIIDSSIENHVMHMARNISASKINSLKKC